MCTNNENPSINSGTFGALMSIPNLNKKRAPVISMAIERVPLERFQSLKCTLMCILNNAHWYNFRRFSHIRTTSKHVFQNGTNLHRTSILQTTIPKTYHIVLSKDVLMIVLMKVFQLNLAQEVFQWNLFHLNWHHQILQHQNPIHSQRCYTLSHYHCHQETAKAPIT